jgi:hypothetical protein
MRPIGDIWDTIESELAIHFPMVLACTMHELSDVGAAAAVHLAG